MTPTRPEREPRGRGKLEKMAWTPSYKISGTPFYFSEKLPWCLPETRRTLLQDIEQGSKHLSEIFLFIELTGPLPKDPAEREKLIEQITPALQNENFFRLLESLQNLKKWAALANLVTEYTKGNITPELAKILDIKYEWPPEYYATNFDDRALLFKLLGDGKLDFSPYMGKHDIEENWQNFFIQNYRVAFQPLPSMRRSIEAIKEIAPGQFMYNLQHVKAEALLLLGGTGPDTWQREAAGWKGANNYVMEPVPPEQLEHFADAIESQYQRRQTERTRRDFSAPFIREQDAGFYVNPETCVITDLRPYWKELHKLLSVKSWRYLKDFAAAIRRAILEHAGDVPAKQEPQKPHSLFDKAFIKMFNTPAANDIVNINNAVSGSPTGKQCGQQNLFTKEWEYKINKTELNVPIKNADGKVLPPQFTTSTWKLLHFVSLLFTADNSSKEDGNIFPVVDTTVAEYMAATGRKITPNTIKEVTKTIKRDLETLNEIKIKYTDKKYSLDLIRPFPGVHLKRGKIRVSLEPAFAEYLARKTGFLMNYPAALLKLKEINSNLYPLGYKLALNRSNDANIRRGKANILSVAVCLECCPGIPTIEKVRKEGKGYSPAKRIIEPFEKAMDALQQQGVLERWEYCLSKGEPLGQPDVNDYNYFASLYVLYEIKDFPIGEELPRIQATAEKRQKRKERIERLIDSNVAKGKARAILEHEESKTE